MKKIIFVLIVICYSTTHFAQENKCYLFRKGFIVTINEKPHTDRVYISGNDLVFFDSTNLNQLINCNSIFVNMDKYLFNSIFDPAYINDTTNVFNIYFEKAPLKECIIDSGENVVTIKEVTIFYDEEEITLIEYLQEKRSSVTCSFLELGKNICNSKIKTIVPVMIY